MISWAVSTGGGLVEHEDAGVAVEGAEDLDALLHADAHILDAGVRVDREPVAVGELLDALARRAAVEDPERTCGPGLTGSLPSTMFSATVITGRT